MPSTIVGAGSQHWRVWGRSLLSVFPDTAVSHDLGHSFCPGFLMNLCLDSGSSGSNFPHFIRKLKWSVEGPGALPLAEPRGSVDSRQ